MTGRVFLAYLVVVAAELTVGIIFGMPWWLIVALIAATTAAWAAAAWLGLTRPDDEGRHSMATLDADHPDHPDNHRGGVLSRWMWRGDGPADTGELDAETMRIDASAASRIDRADATRVDLEQDETPSLPQTLDRSRGNQ